MAEGVGVGVGRGGWTQLLLPQARAGARAKVPRRGDALRSSSAEG